ncbi:RmlC-like cupin domain-containing protein [Aspergillus avenaceus]|uniref:RmlC-like cupin domain-containing protein n=1 Tax=Aspergillus avenaceus TaxID=36643 RepID=A0A5N6TSI7_ASPAV|nr:RmlC-like cupin domain-containing protein [Aspergillus avenaceus]
MDVSIAAIRPHYSPVTNGKDIVESPSIQNIIEALRLSPHPEGGFFNEVDRHPLRITNPHRKDNNVTGDEHRSASTTIYYFLTPQSPLGHFHRNQSRTVHTLHRGRGRYVIIHADQASENGGKAPIESFIVGHQIEKGERLQWIVEGGKYKSSYLLPDPEAESSGQEETKGLLISETVVPGFEFDDHDFLTEEGIDQLLTPEQVQELRWMVRSS